MKTLYDLITAAEKTKAERKAQFEREAVDAYRKKLAREKLVANTWASGAGILWDAEYMACEEAESSPLYTISILTDGTTLDKWYDNGCEGACHVAFTVRIDGVVVSFPRPCPYLAKNKNSAETFQNFEDAIVYSIS